MLKTEKNKKNYLSIFTYFLFKKPISFILISSLFIGAVIGNSKLEKIHVKNEKNFVEAHVNNSQKKVKIKENLTYYWYKSRSINFTRGGYAGSLLEGGFDRFSLSKTLIEQGQFKKGLKIGKWKTWFTNGELKSVCSYRKGLKHGKEITYNMEGLVVSEAKYSKGEIVF